MYNNIPFQSNGSESSKRKCPDSKSVMTVEEVAMGFIRVANEAMCRPIRALTQVEGCFFYALAFWDNLHCDCRKSTFLLCIEACVFVWIFCVFIRTIQSTSSWMTSDCPITGQRSRHLPTRPGVFRRCGRAARLCHCQSAWHEEGLHTQVRQDLFVYECVEIVV